MPELSIGASFVKIDQGEVGVRSLENFLVFAHYLFLVGSDWKSAQGILGVRIPYCYYYLRVLYFANFCDLEKVAKLSTRKNFYQHITHSGVPQSQTG